MAGLAEETEEVETKNVIFSFGSHKTSYGYAITTEKKNGTSISALFYSVKEAGCTRAIRSLQLGLNHKINPLLRQCPQQMSLHAGQTHRQRYIST